MMNTNQKRNTKETTTLILFLLYSFAIAWCAEFILIFLYKMNFISGSFAQLFHFGAIGFGAGMAPVYGTFIVMKKQDHITLKEFCKKIFQTQDCKKSLFILILFAVIQFLACFLLEQYAGYPWYFFILFMPMMIFGGGLEEIGWQGIFQPLLQKQFPFLIATIIGGIVWSIWHIPLWFVPNTAQSNFHFVAFTLYCITLGTTLAVAHKLTNSIWVSVLLHAWGNTVLGGMYSLTSLCSFPSWKVLLVCVVQILLVMGVLCLIKNKHGIIIRCPWSKPC